MGVGHRGAHQVSQLHSSSIHTSTSRASPLLEVILCDLFMVSLKIISFTLNQVICYISPSATHTYITTPSDLWLVFHCVVKYRPQCIKSIDTISDDPSPSVSKNQSSNLHYTPIHPLSPRTSTATPSDRRQVYNSVVKDHPLSLNLVLRYLTIKFLWCLRVHHPNFILHPSIHCHYAPHRYLM